MAPRPPSLRRRLLTTLAIPMVLAWLASGVIIYLLALHFTNLSYDSSLRQGARALERMVDGATGGEVIGAQARQLLEYDASNPSFYAVHSLARGLLAANLALPLPDPLPATGAPPQVTAVTVGGRKLRMAALRTRPDASGDSLVVAVAETLDERHALAREILVGTLPVLLLLLGSVLGLVWIAVSRGLHLLAPLTRQLAARAAHDLAPLDQSQVPREIRPLTTTIDNLLERLAQSHALQERFIADAAHQLRTPLAGLRLQADRALADPRPASVQAALAHIQRLASDAARAAGQLLALARTSGEQPAALAPLDLAEVARNLVGERARDALARGIDLGYDGPATGAAIHGDAVMLREALANLIDNALAHAGAGGKVTVAVACAEGAIRLEVDDSGPGVDAQWWPRLGERFFRPPGSDRDGSGLGLAIVRRIADRHTATVTFGQGSEGGLRVEIRLPAAPD